jgi:hypothetical protein
MQIIVKIIPQQFSKNKASFLNFLHLTPLIPLSFEGEGESFFKKRGFAPLKHPFNVVIP